MSIASHTLAFLVGFGAGVMVGVAFWLWCYLAPMVGEP